MRACATTFTILSWAWCVLSWDGTTRQQIREHTVAWEAFAADLSRGDCSMTSLSEKARVTLPMGQIVSKEEYRLACASTMADETVEEMTIAAGQLVSTGMWTFSVETTVTTAAVAQKSGIRRRVSYPAAFFLAVDPLINKVTEVRVYAQNIALLAARGYAMVPDDSFAPVIRPV